MLDGIEIRNHVDFNYNQLLRAKFEILDSDPVFLQQGMFWLNSSDKCMKYYNGTDIIVFKQSSNSYIHTQATPSTTWNIQHNLNRTPHITIIDSGNSVVEGAENYVDSNNVTIDFGFPFTGTAYLS